MICFGAEFVHNIWCLSKRDKSWEELLEPMQGFSGVIGTGRRPLRTFFKRDRANRKDTTALQDLRRFVYDEA